MGNKTEMMKNDKLIIQKTEEKLKLNRGTVSDFNHRSEHEVCAKMVLKSFSSKQ
jgi:hypothetical protein